MARSCLEVTSALFQPCSARGVPGLTYQAIRLDLRQKEAAMANHKNLPDAVNNAWMLPGTQIWWSSVSEYQSEMFDFMSHRLSKDSVALHGLGECRNWNEVSDLYSSWAQDMSKDYSTEATKVIDIYTKRASDAARERRPRH
jgi:hypothetical protein